jgi:hypothetical protein
MAGLRKALVVSVVVASACSGSSPSAPSSPTLGGGIPFQVQTRYSMTMVGDVGSCGDNRSPRSGTAVTLDLTMMPDATGWTATPANQSAGTLSLRFQQGSAQVPTFQVSLSGTARGFADDQGIAIGTTPPVPTGTRATFGATGAEAIPVTGLLSLGQFASGTFDGTVVFSRNGLTSTCPGGVVTWTMNRFSG